MERIRVPLGEYVTEYSVRNKADEDIPVYSVTNSQGFCTEYFDKEVASKNKTTYKIVPRGYFAYNPSRIYVGSVDWQRYEDRVIVSPLYNVFSVSENMDQQYLYYFLRSDIGRQMIKAKASGSVRDNLKMNILKEMTIPERTIKEQKQCVSILDELNEIIALREKEIDKLNELIKARLNQVAARRPAKAVAQRLGSIKIYRFNSSILSRNLPLAKTMNLYEIFSFNIFEEFKYASGVLVAHHRLILSPLSYLLRIIPPSHAYK